MRGLAVLTLALIAQQAHAGTLKDEVDRFTGMRSVVWSSIPESGGRFSFSTAVRYRDGSNTPTSHSVWINTYSARFRFDNCNSVAWLLDGERFTLPMDYEMDVGSDVAIEHFFFTGKRELLERIAAAHKAEFLICNEESAISEADHNGLRQVLQITK